MSTPPRRSSYKESPRLAEKPLFDKENKLWMAIGAVVIIAGFLLMAGGGSTNPNVFNASEVYSTRRITIAPIVILLGLVIEIYAIFRKPASGKQESAA